MKTTNNKSQHDHNMFVKKKIKTHGTMFQQKAVLSCQTTPQPPQTKEIRSFFSVSGGASAEDLPPLVMAWLDGKRQQSGHPGLEEFLCWSQTQKLANLGEHGLSIFWCAHFSHRFIFCRSLLLDSQPHSKSILLSWSNIGTN